MKLGQERMVFRTIGLALAACLATAPASAMSVADFLVKADALKAKGMMALFSSDLSLLKREVQTGLKAWMAQVAPPGKPANACPPTGNQTMTVDDIMAIMKAVPPTQRASTDTADALTAGMNRRFPCHS